MATVELDHRDPTLIRIVASPMESHLSKTVPGGIFDRSDFAWYVPRSFATCLALRGVYGPGLQIGGELAAWGWTERKDRIEPCMALRTALSTDATELTPRMREVLDALDRVEAADPSGRKLFAYQRVDVLFMVLSRRCILGNEPGLGKTAVAIRVLQVMNALGMDPFPALVVCPNGLKHTVWARELALMAPELAVRIVDGSAAARRKQLVTGADVYVINYESVRLHSNLAQYGENAMTEKEKAPKELNTLSLRTVFFDESHRIRNIKSASSRERSDGTKVTAAQATRAAWAVSHGCQYRFTMTGTPVANHVGDMWSQAYVTEPTWVGSRSKFLGRYAQLSFGSWGGMEVLGIKPETKGELDAMLQPLMRRVPKAAALPQLPEKLPVQYRYTPMNPAQAKMYKQMEGTLLAELLDGSITMTTKQIVKFTRLGQFASAAATMSEDGSKVVLADPSNKVDDLIEVLEEMGEAPLVVAAVSRQLIEIAARRLDKEGISYTMITGSVDPQDRTRAVDAFQDGQVRVMLLTLGAGAEGITLTRADTMLFMQESYETVQNNQAQDRIYRIGSEGHQCIRIIVQITPGTVEERRMDLLAAKQERIEELVQDKEALLKLLGKS